MKVVMKLKNKARKEEENETDWREKKVNDSQGPSRHFERMDDP